MFSPTELRYGLKKTYLVLAKATLSFGLRGARKALWRYNTTILLWSWKISELPPFENDDEKRLQKKGDFGTSHTGAIEELIISRKF